MRFASLTTFSDLSLPADSYIYKIAHVNGILAAISSDDSLRLIDIHTLREIAGGVLNKVHDGVTCLQLADHDPSSLLTAGRDGVVQQYDLRIGQKTMNFSYESKTPYLSLSSHGTNIAAGTELTHSQAAVLIWDTRQPNRPLQKYTESHNDDITDLQFHPTLPHRLLSGSTDSLVNIYSTSHSDEDDALIQVHNHGSSIHRAGFLSRTDFFALSHDETFSIYQLNEPGMDPTDDDDESSPTVFNDLRPQLDCEYVVDIIPSGTSGVEAILGAGSHSKQYLDLVPLRLNDDVWFFDPSQTIRLSGAHGEEIVRSMHVSNEDGTVFTAGEDGVVRAWRTSGGGVGEEESAETEGQKKAKKKKKGKSVADDGHESGRFKPY